MKRRSPWIICLLFCLLGLLIALPAFAATGVTSPNGGESLNVGSVYQIKWNFGTPVASDYMTIAFSSDSGTTWSTVADSVPNNGSYDWTVPDTVTTKGRIKITLWKKYGFPPTYVYLPLSSDVSDADFSIKIPSIIIPVFPIFPLIVPPAAPSELTAVVADGTVKLAWKDNSNNEAQFKIERSQTNNTSYSEILGVPANTQTATDVNGLVSLKKYYYRVKATNLAGSSAYSNEVSVTMPLNFIVPVFPFDPTPDPVPDPAPDPTPDPSPSATVIKFYIDSPDYFVNGGIQTMDTNAVSIEGRTLLPIKYVADPLGATVVWDAITQKVTVTLGSKTIELWIGNNTARVNGVDKKIDPNNDTVKPVILPPGRTMLPLRFIGENLDCQIDWDAAIREAKLTYTP